MLQTKWSLIHFCLNYPNASLKLHEVFVRQMLTYGFAFSPQSKRLRGFKLHKAITNAPKSHLYVSLFNLLLNLNFDKGGYASNPAAE